MPLLSFFRKNLQAILAFSLLGFQLWIPWSVPYLLTEDGPSHVYTAVVARELLFHRHSPYAAVYAFNHHVVPNWGTTVVMGLITSVFGVAHAEQVFMTLSLCAGFFAFAYGVHSISPDAARFTPLNNFLLQTWFLWLGFYNFYLAMVLCPLVIGYFIRHSAAFTLRKAAIFAAGMIALFLTHLVPAALVGMTVTILALWNNFVAERLSKGQRSSFLATVRKLVPVGLAFVPVLILFVWFASGQTEKIQFAPDVLHSLMTFPQHVFATSSGRAGNQFLLFPSVLCLIVVAIGVMRREEWMTARGGIALGTVAAFLIYLFIPDAGLGGNAAKIRFSWGVFMLGGLLLATSHRLRPFRVPFDVYAAVLLLATFVSTQGKVRNYSDAADDYLKATRQIPAGSRVLRIGYPVPDIPRLYDYEDIGRNPLFHADSFMAARCRCVDLGDYQAPNNIFPVVFNKKVSIGARYDLWSFELPGADAGAILKWLETALPVSIDYVILVADDSTPEIHGPGYAAVSGLLNREMHPIGTSSTRDFVRVYERNR